MNYKPSEYLKEQNPHMGDSAWEKAMLLVTVAFDGAGDDFSSRILQLTQKADSANRERLRKGFPQLVMLGMAWKTGDIEMVNVKEEE